MGSKAKRATRETPYQLELSRVRTMRSVARLMMSVRDYDATTVRKLTVPGNINTTGGGFAAPSRSKPKVIQSEANAETVARWAADHAARVAVDRIAEQDRRAAYRKLHTLIAGNPAKRTGGID